MKFPNFSDDTRIQRLKPPQGAVRMVLDTDTYNEIDDQFAVAYALLSPEKLMVEALYAAPFSNNRSSGPGDGMEKSYEEILRLTGRLGMSHENFVYRGSTRYFGDQPDPERSPAAIDLIERAISSPDDDPLYVVAIGAISNVAAAIAIEPEIIRKIVVVWLAGQPHHFPFTTEFNFSQDLVGSRLLLDCGVPLVQIPCLGVASHLLTTKAELQETIAGRNAISDFLYERFCEYSTDHFAWAKEVWDISTIAYLLNDQWVATWLGPAPTLNENALWQALPNRHTMRVAYYIHRNPVFRDLFQKLQKVQ